MELTILGAGTALPVPQRSASSVLVRVDETPLLFDIGPGTVPRMEAAGTSCRDLEHVFLTHHHPDHTLDLVTFLQVNCSTPGWTRTRPVHLVGCRGTRRFYGQLMEAFPGIAPQSYALDVREVAAESWELGGWVIESVLTGHTDASVGFRVQAEGRAVAYSGDAVESEDLVRLARDADAFVCECAFPKGWPTADHMTADAAGRIANRAKVKRVLLTHLYPPAQQADVAAQVREEYGGEVIVAVDGTRVAV